MLRVLLPLSSLVAIAPGAQNPVEPPVGWYVGDTHDHVQLCRGKVIPPIQVLGQMMLRNLDLACVSIWGRGIHSRAQFDSFMANVTGVEHPFTVGLPQIIQFCVEISEFEAAKLGHVLGLGVGPAQTQFYDLGLGCPNAADGSGDYAAPILDLFRTAPGAVTGYAHQVWPIAMYVDQRGFDWEAPELPDYVGIDARCSQGKDFAFPPLAEDPLRPVLAPFDVVTRRIDFLEAPSMDTAARGGVHESRWYGMYYKLLSAGVRVSISAGSDADCIPIEPSPRTWVQIDEGAALDFEQWIRNLAAGRVSLANGPSEFLEMHVGGVGPGGEASIETSGRGAGAPPPTVGVDVVLHLGDHAAPNHIEVIRNGEVVAGCRVADPSPGRHRFHFDVPAPTSCWIAVRTQSMSSHTAAAYVIVNGAPIANCAVAEYWMVYCDSLSWQLDEAGRRGVVADLVGCSELEIRNYIAKGRRMFAALRDYDLPLPTDVKRYGRPAPPSCTPPSSIVTSSSPRAGQPFDVRGFNAPSNALGALLVGTTSDPYGTPMAGARLWVGLLPDSFVFVPVAANEGGFVELVPRLPAGVADVPYFMQFVWVNPAGCDALGVLSSSDGLAVVVRR